MTPAPRDDVRRQFDAAAPQYGSSSFHARYAAELVARAPLREGDAVLDAGCGTGLATLPAARAVAPSGAVVGVDISPAMIETARAAADAEGVANATFTVGDAASLPGLHDGSFDAVLCSSAIVYMAVADALGELRRLLRPGGHVAFSTMASDAPRAGVVFREAASRHGLSLPNPNAVGTPERCVALLQHAGFVSIEVAEAELEPDPGTAQGAWQSNSNAAVFSAIRALEPACVDAIRRDYLRRLTGDDLACPHRVLFAVAARARPDVQDCRPGGMAADEGT